MTLELFKNNSYIKTFDASIVNTIKREDFFLLELNQTAFYPEGGGQPSDTGFIGTSEVLDVLREDDTIYHMVKTLPEKNTELTCKIHWTRRYDLMQQHTGQHLLSAAIEKLYDSETVGFHLSNNYTTIDIDKKLTPSNIETIELEINRLIYTQKPINILYPDQETLKKMALRKQPKVTKDIRVIEIEGYDFSPCGGTHLGNLSEVGMIKVTSIEKYKSGLRLEFVCGHRAVNDYIAKNHIINSIAKNLATKPLELLSKFQQTMDQQQDMRKELKALKDTLLDMEFQRVKASPERIGVYKIYQNTFDKGTIGDLRKIAATLCTEENTLSLMGLRETNKASLIFACSKDLAYLDMKKLFDQVVSKIDGRGGGNSTSAQGSGSNINGLQLALDEAYLHVIQQL